MVGVLQAIGLSHHLHRLARAVICMAALAVLAACTSAGQNSSSGTENDLYRAVVREATGEIILPMEQFTLSHQERQVLNYARRLVVAECMAKAGYNWPTPDLRGEPAPINLRYGIFGERLAAEYGYVGRPESPEMAELARLNALELTPDEKEALVTCGETEELLLLKWEDPAPGDLASFALHSEVVERSPEGQAVVARWHECLATQGISVSEGDWIPSGVGLEVDENHIRVAVADARCKNETQLVQTLAGLEAAAQASVIRDNEVVLVEQRRQADEVVAAAEEVIARNAGG